MKGGREWPKELRHWPYIASLPSPGDLSTPMFFTQAEMQLLQGTNLYGAIAERQEEWQSESKVVSETLEEEGLTWYVGGYDMLGELLTSAIGKGI
jgi:hypothetical protein